LLLAVATTLAASCDKVPLTAPTNSTVTLFADTSIVAVNGSAEIIATVTESAGTAVQNGTVVTFTTNLGSIEPREARTEGGKAYARYYAGGVSGTAKIGAFSGSAKATEIELKVGGAAASRVLLNVTPGTVPSGGGTVTLTATITDTDGNRLSGVPVTFTATTGSLLSGTVLTDENGEARTSLTTNREATVTATAGNQQAQVTVRVNTLLTVSVTSSTSNPTVGQSTSFSVSVAASANSAAVREVVIDFGDGEVQSLGAINGTTTVTHVYRSTGMFTVTVTATDVGGDRVSASTIVNVAAASRPLATLTVPSSVAANAIFTATVAVSQVPTNVSVDSVQFNFGDGNVKRVNSLQTTHAYGAAGNYNVRAVVTFSDGQTATAEAGIRVTASTATSVP
jgi:adhesin/invasin